RSRLAGPTNSPRVRASADRVGRSSPCETAICDCTVVAGAWRLDHYPDDKRLTLWRRAMKRLVFFAAAMLVLAEAVAADGPGPLAARMQQFVDQQALSGAVTLVAQHGRIVSLDAVGLADIETGRPMRQDSLFWIASM